MVKNRNPLKYVGVIGAEGTVRIHGSELKRDINVVLFAEPRVMFFPNFHQVRIHRLLVNAA